MGVVADVAAQSAAQGDREPVVNDFSMVVATANGTGSQTANLAILRAFFKMGIPINGKNIFPSNIQGQPTWYHIRVSHEGYVARRHQSEFLIAFNDATVEKDVASLPAGGVCLHNADWRSMPERDDIIYYGVPVNQFVRATGMKGKLRDYIANMVYVGAFSYLIGIPLEQIDAALDHHFKGRRKLIDQNMDVVRAAYAWSEENLTKVDPYSVEPMDETAGKFLITGNESGALGAVFGGMTVCAWYPITPSTSFVDALNDYLPRFRKDPETGKPTYAVVQAEDELAAIGMVTGAGWAGARALTATSGPGVSLMAEFAGMAYFAEIPSVIWNIQRVGPSTGLPTRTGQGDVTFCYYLGHGDTKNVLLFPSTVAECFEFGSTAHDLADRLQTLILVLSDLDLGMNNWMTDRFEYPEKALDRGKVLTAQEVADKGFARYKDIDGDGIGYRTLPGNEHPRSAYFVRGTGHDENALYSEDSDVWQHNMDRLVRKFDTARDTVPGPVVEGDGDAKIGIIAYGTTRFAIEEARDRLQVAGVKTDFMRLRALPINDDVKQFVADHDVTYVIELNRDGQVHSILRDEMPEMVLKLHSLALLDGMPLTARWVVDAINKAEEANNG